MVDCISFDILCAVLPHSGDLFLQFISLSIYRHVVRVGSLSASSQYKIQFYRPPHFILPHFRAFFVCAVRHGDTVGARTPEHQRTRTHAQVYSAHQRAADGVGSQHARLEPRARTHGSSRSWSWRRESSEPRRVPARTDAKDAGPCSCTHTCHGRWDGAAATQLARVCLARQLLPSMAPPLHADPWLLSEVLMAGWGRHGCEASVPAQERRRGGVAWMRSGTGWGGCSLGEQGRREV